MPWSLCTPSVNAAPEFKTFPNRVYVSQPVPYLVRGRAPDPLPLCDVSFRSSSCDSPPVYLFHSCLPLPALLAWTHLSVSVTCRHPVLHSPLRSTLFIPPCASIQVSSQPIAVSTPATSAVHLVISCDHPSPEVALPRGSPRPLSVAISAAASHPLHSFLPT